MEDTLISMMKELDLVKDDNKMKPPKEEAKESRSNYINRLTNNKDRNELDFSWNKNLSMV